MRIHVKPKTKGATIRDPHTRRPLPEDGAEVNDSRFWRRRAAAEEVELVEVAEKPAATPTGLEPLTPLTTRGRALPLPPEHTERTGTPDAGDDDR